MKKYITKLFMIFVLTCSASLFAENYLEKARVITDEYTGESHIQSQIYQYKDYNTKSLYFVIITTGSFSSIDQSNPEVIVMIKCLNDNEWAEFYATYLKGYGKLETETEIDYEESENGLIYTEIVAFSCPYKILKKHVTTFDFKIVGKEYNAILKIPSYKIEDFINVVETNNVYESNE